MSLFKPGRNSLQHRIDSTAERLKNRRGNLQQHRSEVSQRLSRQLATPQTLMWAGGAGFLLGELQLLRPVSAPSADNASTAKTLAWAPNVGLVLKISQEMLSWAHEVFNTMAEPTAPQGEETSPDSRQSQ